MTSKAGNHFKSLGLKFAAAGLFLVAVAALYYYCTPRIFEADSRIRVWKRGYLQTNGAAMEFGPETLPGECQFIRSSNVLDQVTASLNLNVLWGRLYNLGKPITIEQSRERLRQISKVHPLRNSSIIEILVQGAEPDEPASIANELARVYLEARRKAYNGALAENAAALRAEWVAQNQNVQESQAALDKLYFEISSNRATNPVRVFDPEAYAKIQSGRIDLESKFVSDKKTLEELKAMDRRRLREVLSTLDTNPDSLLNNTILQLLKARRELASAQGDHGPDSTEVRHATLVVDQLDRQIDQQIDNIMAAKEADLSSLKASLEKMTKLAQQAGTNSDANGIKRANEQDARYENARRELAALKERQDKLQQEMDSTDATLKDELPIAISAEIVDSADPPSHPAVPDRRIALAASGGGLMSAVLGACFFALGGRTRKIQPERRS